MTITAVWFAPKNLPILTDLEFKLKNGENIMVSWESATFNKSKFEANGVSTTNADGRVQSGNLDYLKENIESLEKIHYLSDCEEPYHIKTIVFTDTVRGRYKSETWRFENDKFRRLM